MPVSAKLDHHTCYRYDRPATLGPQRIRLRPAAHTRTPVTGFSLRVEPECHLLYWQQDPYNNWVARVLFSEPVERFEIHTSLTAELHPMNPFDFVLEPEAAQFPFHYDTGTAAALYPYLHLEAPQPPLFGLLAETLTQDMGTVAYLTRLNATVAQRVRYLRRMEAGVQTPEHTLTAGEGSCRDSAWLLVHLLRHLGLAARFVSGYLIQLGEDGAPAADDHTDLHAWTEVFLPGAGWVGMDPSSGLLAAAGHIPVAATADPESAAPVSGLVSPCESDFSYTMRLYRQASGLPSQPEPHQA